MWYSNQVKRNECDLLGFNVACHYPLQIMINRMKWQQRNEINVLYVWSVTDLQSINLPTYVLTLAHVRFPENIFNGWIIL